MGTCPKCGQDVGDLSTTCQRCGQVLPAESIGTLDGDFAFGTAEPLQPPNPIETAQTISFATSEFPIDTVEPVGSGDQQPGAFASTIELTDSPYGTAPIPANDDPQADATLVSPSMIDDLTGQHDTADGVGTRDAGSGTLAYGTQEFSDAEQGRGESGTLGRLKRLWRGSAAANLNPMRTIKTDDALASDSIFSRIARRGLVTDTANQIIESISLVSSSSQQKRKEVEECIVIACRGTTHESADYNLTGYLGQGGMGIVLKGYQKAIGRDVAIKMAKPKTGGTQASAENQRKKFFYEAQITGRLDHPNIVPVYDLGVSNDVMFYSMKLIIGTAWESVIRENSQDANLDIFMKVADAMAFAHQKNIIHRDLKPENVMLGPFGEVLVTDWGCAVDLNRGEKYSGAGSPPWMAPEMADHDITKIGLRSDVYLLGAILYQIIAGYPPHPGRTQSECIFSAYDNIILPVDKEDPLLEIALKAMKSAPEDRYPSVEALQEAVREHRRHAESLVLTDRAETLAQQANELKDYERFSRALFAFQDAVELWPENKLANEGLAKTRLSYGRCAFEKGDFDLCLQSLNRDQPAEAALWAEADRAKKLAIEREGRVRRLRRVLTSVVLFGLVAMSLLSMVALWQARQASNNAEAFRKERDFARVETKRANDETERAVEAEIKAKNLADSEKAAKEAAEGSSKEAIRQQKIAEDYAFNADLSALEAMVQRWNASKAEKAALLAREEAQTRAAQVELSSYQSNLALALSQVRQFDTASASTFLDSLVHKNSYKALLSMDQLPKFQNWAWNRVDLLSNRKLLGKPISEQASDLSTIRFATAANRGVVATSNRQGGQLHLVEIHHGQVTTIQTKTMSTPIESVAIAPDGREVIYSLAAGEHEGTVYRWDTATTKPPVAMPAGSGNRRTMQQFVISAQHVVGGINGGLWVWDRDNSGQLQEAKAIRNLRGRLKALQLLDNSRAIALAELPGIAPQVFLIDLAQRTAGRIEFTKDPSGRFEPENLTAVAVSQETLLLGTSSGRIFSCELKQTTDSNYRELLPQRHQLPIQAIQSHSDGHLLTLAAEPFVHVWRPSASVQSGWEHQTALSGTIGNVGGAAFLPQSSQVVGVGEDGRPILWDIDRQLQRQRLARTTPQGEEVINHSPILSVVVSASNDRAVSIHEDGSIDTWNPITGRTMGDLSPTPMTYIGHQPGATFVDMEIDERSNTLVTSAALARKSVAEDRKWEFVRWDLESGKMVDRWIKSANRQSESDSVNARQEISLLDNGKFILYASNTATRIEALSDRSSNIYRAENLGSSFAVQHPTTSNIAMLVKSNGAVRVFDLNRPDQLIATLDRQSNDFNSLVSNDDVPLLGRWAPDGRRFFLVWETGRITEIEWQEKRLSVMRDLKSDQLKKLGIALSGLQHVASTDSKVGSTVARLSSRWQADLKVRQQDRFNLVYLATRLPGPEGRTRLLRVGFPIDKGEVVVTQSESILGHDLVVLNDEEAPGFFSSRLDRYPIPVREIAAAQYVGKVAFIANGSGDVYRTSQDEKTTVFGRPPALSGSGSRTADRIVVLHRGGVLWRADWQGDQWQWTPLRSQDSSAISVCLSPDGSHLAVTTGDGIVLAKAENGEIVHRLDGASSATWGAEKEIAAVYRDGSIQLHNLANGQSHLVSKYKAQSPRSIQFFHELIETQAPIRWLVVQDGEQLLYFGADQVNAGKTGVLNGLPDNCRMACSPNENVFLIGGSEGSVAVYFAAPSSGSFGNRLFDLEGHAGSSILELRFAPDGNTVYSSDSKRRLFGWMAKDHLESPPAP